MMYKALIQFRDLEDMHLYNPGDVFPHDNREVPQERINALVSGQNRANRALIVEVVNNPPATPEAPKRATRGRKKA